MSGHLNFMYEVPNLTVSNQISLNLTRAKLRPASPNHRLRCALFWDIMQLGVVIPYWLFRTTYWSHLQGSINPMRENIAQLKFT